MMDSTRWLQLSVHGGKLTHEELAEGWHYCPDWDFMLIHPKDPEAQACLCNEEEEARNDS